MKSFATTDFWKAYARLTPDMKEQARKAYQLWRQNPLHPSLHFKKVGKNLWSARVTGGYRALALKKGDDYYWFWIGAHDKYEALLKQSLSFTLPSIGYFWRCSPIEYLG